MEGWGSGLAAGAESRRYAPGLAFAVKRRIAPADAAV